MLTNREKALLEMGCKIVNKWCRVQESNPCGEPKILYVCKDLGQAYDFKSKVIDKEPNLRNKSIFVDEWLKFQNGSIEPTDRIYLKTALPH